MKPDWDTLAKEFKSSKDVVIADVDCTGAGEPLCSRFGVEGFPTIKAFEPPDTEGETYEGERDLASLREYAKTLGPGCSAVTKDMCDPSELAELEALMAKPKAELDAELEELKSQLADAKKAHDELLESLQAQYEKSEQSLGELKKTLAPKLKKLRAATASPPASGGKDEV
jgi:protein disulfide-isomerase A6